MLDMAYESTDTVVAEGPVDAKMLEPVILADALDATLETCDFMVPMVSLDVLYNVSISRHSISESSGASTVVEDTGVNIVYEASDTSVLRMYVGDLLDSHLDRGGSPSSYIHEVRGLPPQMAAD